MCSVTKEQVYDELSTIIDPEVGFNLVEMGLIYDVEVKENCDVKVTMTLSTKACPMHQMIVQWVEDAPKRLDGVENVEVNLVWEPEWNISMAADNVKQALGAL
jgi:metal-sulfur cluster biosynthetic enzyme